MDVMTYSLLLFAVLIFPCLRCQDATFRVPEEQKNVLVGSIPDGIHLTSILALETVNTLTYSFLTHGYPDSRFFSLNNSTGELRTAVPVDREEVCGFQIECVLVIQVAIQSSSDQYFKKIKLHIVVEDVNDNSPEFPASSVTLQISEDVSQNTSYAIDGAIDRDIGKNGLQDYELVTDGGPFVLNISKRLDGGQTVSLIVGDGLDREKRSYYTLRVKARDGGQPQRTGELTLDVVVVDVNDNSPQFTPSSYNVSVNETIPLYSIILTVSATDADDEENGIDFYRFSSMKVGDFEKYVSINNRTGEIFVISDLEPVQGERFTFVVECVDKGSPPLVSQALVELQVDDSVNSPPRINFNLLSSGQVSEYALPGTVVAHVAVHDPDYGENGMIKCFMISNTFELDALGVNEYKVNLMRTVDREVESEVNVSITCEDSGDPPLKTSTDFSIKIRDENDHTPYFLQDIYTAYLDENVKDVVVTQVTAQDDDVGENGEIEYFIPYDWQIGLTALPNGEIVCNKAFDREATPKIALTVVARDKGTPSRNHSTTVIITINDVNDVTPAFYKQEFSFSIPENQPVGTTFGSVVAFDLDLRDGGELKYFLEEDEDFDIDVTYDGLLKTRVSLDREVKDSYRFRVWVADGGKPTLSSSAIVIVNVTDRNDNYPVIRFPDLVNSSLIIPHDTPAGTVVMQVEAQDDDADGNGLCQFYMLPHDDDNDDYNVADENDNQAAVKVLSMFDIHRDSGELTLKQSLKKEDVGHYTVTVLVRDQGMPPLMSNLTLDIHIVLSNHTSGVMNKENAVVVAVVGSLTGVVSVIVVITIVLMRRRDRLKQKYSAPSIVSHPAPSDLKPVGSLETHEEENRRNTKSGEDSDSRNGSYDALRQLTESHDKHNDDASFKDGIDLDEDRNESSILSEVERHWLADAKTVPDWSTALKLHQDLLKLHGVQTKILPQTHFEDGHSDSSEEVATSDSGRGGSGSDEDSHGRASPDSKHEDESNTSPATYNIIQTLRNKSANYVNMGYDSMHATPINTRRKAEIWNIDSHGSAHSTPSNNSCRKVDVWEFNNDGSGPSTPANSRRKADVWDVESHGSAASTPRSCRRKADTWTFEIRGSIPSTPINGCRKSDLWEMGSQASPKSTPRNGQRKTDAWTFESYCGNLSSPVNGCRSSDSWKMVDKTGSSPSTPVNGCRKSDSWKISNTGSNPSTPVNGCRKSDSWKISNTGSNPSTPVNGCRKSDSWKICNTGSNPSTPVNGCRKKWTINNSDGFKKRLSNPGQKRVTFQPELHHTVYNAYHASSDVTQSIDDDDTTTSGSYSVDVDHDSIDTMLPRIQDMVV